MQKSILLLLLVGIIGCGEQADTAETLDEQTPVVETSEVSDEAPTPEPGPNIGMERSRFENKYRFDVDFQEGIGPDGREVLDGKGEDKEVQVVGPEDAVEQVSVTWYMAGDEVHQGVQNLGRMAFTTMFGLEANNWVNDVVERGGLESSWGTSETFDGRLISVELDADDPNKPLMILVKPAEAP